MVAENISKWNDQDLTYFGKGTYDYLSQESPN